MEDYSFLPGDYRIVPDWGYGVLMKYYTGVGSRESPQEVLELMEDFAMKMAKEGYVLRSGGADGADWAFETGCRLKDGAKEIYLPWDGFSKMEHNPKRGYYAPKEDEVYTRAEEIASKIHPAWDRLTQGAKRLHTRNVYQVLGQELNDPSKFLLCYAKPSGNSISGGTRTAWEVAKMFGVPCFNMYHEEVVRRVEFYLEG